MSRVRVMFGLFVCAVAMAVVLADSGYSQDKQDKKDAQAAGKVAIPQSWNFSKLKITGDQKKKILDVIGSYQAKLAVLKDQMDNLKKDEYAEAFKLLSDDQKMQLKKIADEKTDPTKKGDDNKKADDKKKSGR